MYSYNNKNGYIGIADKLGTNLIHRECNSNKMSLIRIVYHIYIYISIMNHMMMGCDCEIVLYTYLSYAHFSA